MKPERCAKILSTGFCIAQERMAKYPDRPEYPHDFERLYGGLEDKLFYLYEAIKLKQYDRVRVMSGEVIVTASEVAEHSLPYARRQKRKRRLWKMRSNN